MLRRSMRRRIKHSDSRAFHTDQYDAVLAEVIDLLETARRTAARAVNAVLTGTYWQIGRWIVELEQAGSPRAQYGGRLLPRLSDDLTNRFGRGFSVDNLEIMRRFYVAYRPALISETASRKLASNKSETRSRKSADLTLQTASEQFPLPWSHYVRLLSVENEQARAFYETEALRGGWTVKQLARQIGSGFSVRGSMSARR
jgi:hypothetical protein